ncbi:MAG: M64 family metallopeptidase [Bdellovibrionota bacterium]
MGTWLKRASFSGMCFLISSILSPRFSQADWIVQFLENKDEKKVRAVRHIPRNTAKNPRLLRSIPLILSEDSRPSKVMYREVLYSEKRLPEQLISYAHKTERFLRKLKWPGSEVKTIIEQGPPSNRINLTFLGDGYTEDEKEKFFSDVSRMAKDMFTGQTFASYLPLFNVYAVFVPSNESGLSDRRRVDTVFELYRSPKGSKRAILPGNTNALERAIALAPGADYPIVIANDDFYGGLGGRYAISTRSVRSGNIVLRHELGHNFGEVGEEYDGGQVYSGANFSRSKRTDWDHWSEGPIEAFDVSMHKGEYAWHELKDSPYTMTYNFPSGPAGSYFYALISSVGWSSPDDVHLHINGNRIPIKGEFHDDRGFFQVGPLKGVPSGKHKMVYSENANDGNNVLAISRVYALPENYDFTPDRIGAFATFDDSGRMVGYRPTHDSCLMRDMKKKKFCVVDQENMWTRFLKKVDLIDRVDVSENRTVQLYTPKLKDLSVRWYKVESNGQEVELEDLRSSMSWKADPSHRGTYRAKVRYATPEVRKPTNRFLSAHDFKL